MSGLVAFTSQLGLLFATLLPPICYVGAGVLFLIAGWGFWQQAQPNNPFRGKPWIPVLSLLLSGVLASFDAILTKANVTAGSTVTVSVGALTAYVPPAAPASVLGLTPADTIINVITLFEQFFQAFGAMACLFAVLAWRTTVTGRSNKTQGASLVQFIFGIMLINILTVSQWLVTIFA